jgi:hypothetical protein
MREINSIPLGVHLTNWRVNSVQTMKAPPTIANHPITMCTLLSFSAFFHLKLMSFGFALLLGLKPDHTCDSIACLSGGYVLTVAGATVNCVATLKAGARIIGGLGYG